MWNDQVIDRWWIYGVNRTTVNILTAQLSSCIGLIPITKHVKLVKVNLAPSTGASVQPEILQFLNDRSRRTQETFCGQNCPQAWAMRLPSSIDVAASHHQRFWAFTLLQLTSSFTVAFDLNWFLGDKLARSSSLSLSLPLRKLAKYNLLHIYRVISKQAKYTFT